MSVIVFSVYVDFKLLAALKIEFLQSHSLSVSLGNADVRGISGGQRKRTSIAMELALWPCRCRRRRRCR